MVNIVIAYEYCTFGVYLEESSFTSATVNGPVARSQRRQRRNRVRLTHDAPATELDGRLQPSSGHPSC